MVRSFLSWFLSLLALVPFSETRAAELLAVTGATLIDGNGGVWKDAVLLVEGKRIRAAGREVKVPSHAKRIDAKGKWIVPGLIDAHVHFFQSGGLYTRPDVVDLRTKRSYESEIARIRDRLEIMREAYLCSGITSVVDMGGPFWTFELRDDEAPRVFLSGPLLSPYVPEELRAIDPPNLAIDSDSDVKRAVKAVADRNPDLVKFWWVARGNFEKEFSMAQTAAREAHARNLRLAVHATSLKTAKAALRAGADILVHSVEDEDVDEEFLRLMKERKALYIPTLAVDEGYRRVLRGKWKLSSMEASCGDSDVWKTWRELPAPVSTSAPDATAARNLRKVHRSGILVAAGSDSGNIGTLHGPGLHRELELLQEAGLSPHEVLISATKHAALVAQSSPERGTLEKGKSADFLLLDANPLEDVRNLSKIHKVFFEGREHARKTLRAAS